MVFNRGNTEVARRITGLTDDADRCSIDAYFHPHIRNPHIRTFFISQILTDDADDTDRCSID